MQSKHIAAKAATARRKGAAKAKVPKAKAIATGRMFGDALPARWETTGRESGFALFGPAKKPDGRPTRMHWYEKDSKTSACGNHDRDGFIAITWSTTQVACPRCEETFTLAKKPIPALNKPISEEDES